MAYSLNLRAEPLRSIAFGAIGAGYTIIGTPINQKSRQAIIQNFTDAQIMISFDNVDDHIPMLPLSYLILDVTANQTVLNSFFLSKGMAFYAKQIGVPTSGSVHISILYGQGD